MEPKMLIAAFDSISKAYGELHSRNSGYEESITKLNTEVAKLTRLVAARDREIEELKKQRDSDLPRLAREIDGWKAKHAKAENELSIGKTYAERLSEKLTETEKRLAAETARADALALKYDPQIQAEMAAKAEAERLRLIAELEAKLKALKKE